MSQFVALILDEGKWLTASLTLAALAVVAVVTVYRRRHEVPVRNRVLAAMNLFFGVTIGSMAFGHLLAVTVKLVNGTIEGSLLSFYAIGIVLALPSWWLIYHALGLARSGEDGGRATLALNVWLGATLLALGLHNLPLAAPALFNVTYQLHSRRALGWAIVSVAVVANVGLFIGSLVFLASGQSFEQFSGMD